MVGQAILLTEPNVTGTTSTAYQWYEGDPDTADPITGATSASFTPTATEYALTDPIWRRATYTNATGSTVEDLAAADIVKVEFQEDFSTFMVGDDTTDILSNGWSRFSGGTSHQWQGEIISIAGGPSGKALQWSATSSVSSGGFRTDVDAFFGANGFQTKMSVRALVQATNSGRNAVRGKTSSADKSVPLGEIAGGINFRFAVMCATVTGEDINENPAGGGMGSTVLNDLLFIRIEYEGTVVRTKVWAVDDPEPAFWDIQKDGTPAAQLSRGPAFIARTIGGTLKVLWFSCAGNGDAPYWTDFILPVDLPADPMEYAASAPTTQFAPR